MEGRVVALGAYETVAIEEVDADEKVVRQIDLDDRAISLVVRSTNLDGETTPFVNHWVRVILPEKKRREVAGLIGVEFAASVMDAYHRERLAMAERREPGTKDELHTRAKKKVVAELRDRVEAR